MSVDLKPYAAIPELMGLPTFAVDIAAYMLGYTSSKITKQYDIEPDET